MYSGENVVILNYSECIIQLGIYICYFALLVLCTKLYILSPSKAPRYLEYQTRKSWESKYLIDLELKKYDENCTDNFQQLTLGKWSGITEYTCLCHNDKNIFFASNDKKICTHDSSDNKYKNIFICFEIDKINSEILYAYNNYKFCAKYSTNSIISNHETINKRFDSLDDISVYKDTLITIREPGITDIKISKDINFTMKENYIYKGNYLYIKFNNNRNLNIFDLNEFITYIHYSNELICSIDEMTNINPINDYYKNSKNIYYNNKYCLKTKNDEYKNYYIDDNFVRTSLIDIEYNKNISSKYAKMYNNNTDNVFAYYNKINSDKGIDILSNGINYPFLVGQKYLYGIGCQHYEKINSYFDLFKYFYHNKNLALSIVVFTLVTSVTAIIFVSFNLYQNCVEYPLVYLVFSIILVVSLITDLTLTCVYFGFTVYLRNNFEKIFNECRIDFSGASMKNSNNPFFINSYKKALPLEIGLNDDLNYIFYISLIMLITEVIILILLILYFAFNCYRYTFISLKNERGNVLKSRKVHKRDLMDLVKML